MSNFFVTMSGVSIPSKNEDVYKLSFGEQFIYWRNIAIFLGNALKDKIDVVEKESISIANVLGNVAIFGEDMQYLLPQIFEIAAKELDGLNTSYMQAQQLMFIAKEKMQTEVYTKQFLSRLGK